MIFRYDGTENGFFTLAYDCFLHKELPTRILRGNKASAREKKVNFVSSDSKKANAFRGLLTSISPTLLGEVALALRRLDEGVPLTVLQHVFSLLAKGEDWSFSPKNPAPKFTRFLQMAQLELYRYAGVLQFLEQNGVFYAEIQPLDDIVDLLLIPAVRKLSAPITICDTKRNKRAVWDGNYRIITSQTEEILQEENASFSSLTTYLTPKKKAPQVTQLCFFSQPEKEENRKPYLTLFGVFHPIKKWEEQP